MSDVNHVVLSGRIGRLKEGKGVLFISLASDRYRGATAGNIAEWWSVVVFGARAEHLGRNLQQGQRVTVTGQLCQKTPKDSDKGPRETEIHLSEIVWHSAPAEKEKRP